MCVCVFLSRFFFRENIPIESSLLETRSNHTAARSAQPTTRFQSFPLLCHQKRKETTLMTIITHTILFFFRIKCFEREKKKGEKRRDKWIELWRVDRFVRWRPHRSVETIRDRGVSVEKSLSKTSCLFIFHPLPIHHTSDSKSSIDSDRLLLRPARPTGVGMFSEGSPDCDSWGFSSTRQQNICRRDTWWQKE